MKRKTDHGGALSVGKRKTARPLSTKEAIHVTLKSSHAKGAMSFHARQHNAYLRTLLPAFAKRFHVTLYRFSINANHFHLLLRAKSREGFKRFLMALTGRIAQRMTGAKKGRPAPFRFFDRIPWTRLVAWGRAFREAAAYVLRNELETAGLLPYTPRHLPCPRGDETGASR